MSSKCVSLCNSEFCAARTGIDREFLLRRCDHLAVNGGEGCDDVSVYVFLFDTLKVARFDEVARVLQIVNTKIGFDDILDVDFPE